MQSIETRLEAIEALLTVAFAAQAMTVASDPIEELELLYKAAFRQLARKFKDAGTEEAQRKVNLRKYDSSRLELSNEYLLLTIVFSTQYLLFTCTHRLRYSRERVPESLPRVRTESGLREVKHRYDMIAKAGFLLQVDCPDLAMGRHTRFKERSPLEAGLNPSQAT